MRGNSELFPPPMVVDGIFILITRMSLLIALCVIFSQLPTHRCCSHTDLLLYLVRDF